MKAGRSGCTYRWLRSGLAVVAFLAVAAAGGCAPAGAWTVVPPPVPGSGVVSRPIVFRALDCGGPTSCLAVGPFSMAQDDVGAARWDGAAWAPAPAPPGVPQIDSAVFDCASPTWCVLFDGNGLSGWYAVWDGTGWTTGDTTPTGKRRLNCPVPGVCFSAEFTAEGRGDPAVQRWERSTGWRPVAGSERLPAIMDLSCPTTDVCFATGDTAPGSTYVTRWQGGTWTALPATGPAARFLSISCPTTDRCVMAGEPVRDLDGDGAYDPGAPTEAVVGAWSGGDVTVTALAGTRSADRRPSLSCTGASSCLMTADMKGCLPGTCPPLPPALTATFDGASWRVVPGVDGVPSVSSRSENTMACATPTACFAIGGSRSAPDADSSYIGRWDGTTWVDLGSVDAGGGIVQAELAQVSCATPSACLAVGSVALSSSADYASWWDGTRWTVLPDHPLGPGSRPMAECAGPTRCIAAAATEPAGAAERVRLAVWDGAAWTTTVLAPVPGAHVQLISLSCGAPRWCVAVGATDDERAPARSRFAQAWDGTTWTPIASPLAAPADGVEARDLSCVSPTSCALVDSDNWPFVIPGLPGPDVLLEANASIQRWDGTAWARSTVPSPAPGAEPTLVLDAIDCAAADSCVATGSALRAARGFQPVAARWDGRAWTAGWVNVTGTQLMAALRHVSCSSATQCLAQMVSIDQLGFVDLRWSGPTLTATRTAPPTGSETYFWDLSCAGGDCMAVGAVIDYPERRPATARYRHQRPR
jgi:hypothetical protein